MATNTNSVPPGRTWVPLLILLALLGGLAWVWTGNLSGFRNALDPAAKPRPVVPVGPRLAEEEVTIRVYKSTKPSVVGVATILVQRDRLSLNLRETQAGAGSGFIWDATGGYVVTNFHVVQDAVQSPGDRTVRVYLADHTACNARVVGVAADYDLAVLQIDAAARSLQSISVGTSRDLEVGQNVYAIGNPFGLDLTLTKGIVSALDREIESVSGRSIAGVIQVDAPINPGNSGGPLLDRDGRLIGVNTAIASPSGANAGIGFAIPVDTVNYVVPELIAKGKIARPGLGVTVVQPQVAADLGVAKGVLVQDVLPNGAAAKAGLKPTQRNRLGQIVLGDVIVAIGDSPINSLNDLHRTLSRYKIGDSVKVSINRSDATQMVEVTLQGLEK
jgi:S1-C subfamily serine protease